jgi:hypothetical protein
MTKALAILPLLTLVGCGVGTVSLPEPVSNTRSTPGTKSTDPADPGSNSQDPATTDPGAGGGTTTDKTATLTWEAPTANADGSTPLNDLAGFKVYSKLGGGAYGTAIDVGNKLTYAFNNLSSGTHTFRVSAYDTSGNESTSTAEVSKTIQ